MHLTFEIPGKPMAKQRPRMGKGFTYTPKQTVNYENHVKACFALAYPEHIPLDGQLSMVVIAYWPIPKSKPKKWRELACQGLKWRSSRPDWDNVGKIISDALNDIAYRDDSQIVECIVRKRYDERPRVEVSLRTLSEAQSDIARE